MHLLLVLSKKILDVFYKVIILFNGSLQIAIDILMSEYFIFMVYIRETG